MLISIGTHDYNSKDAKDISFTHEIPGGDMSATFVITSPSGQDIDLFDKVVIYDGGYTSPVWQGFVISVDWTATKTKIECAGWNARFAHLVTEDTIYLDNEKASTFIVDHIISNFYDIIQETIIDTSDSVIPKKREYQAGQTYRAILDDVASLAGYTWYIRGRSFYFGPFSDYTIYRIPTTIFIPKSADVTEYANRVAYSYRNNMTVTHGYVSDVDTTYPTKTIYKPFGDIDGTTAEAAALAVLNIAKEPTGIGDITVDYLTDVFGTPVSLSSVMPGCKIIVRGKKYRLSKTEYSHDTRRLTVSPTPLIPVTFTSLLAQVGS